MPDADSITLIAFDMGGVLSLYDERIPTNELMKLSGKNERQIFDALFSIDKKRPLETGAQRWSDFVSEANSTLELKLSESDFTDIYNSSHYAPNREIFDLVDQLATRYRIGICSNTGPTHWELQKERLPFFRLFDPVVLSFEVGSMKPSPEIFGELSRLSFVPPANILLVDDYIQNVEAARTAGMKSCLFVDRTTLIHDLRKFEIQI